jgi:predicted nucleic acid-binding protein
MLERSSGSTPICVVLDTNIWVYKTSLLRTALGAALINSLLRVDGLLGLPEIVEEEIIKHTVKAGHESAAQIIGNYGEIARLVGWVDEYLPPTGPQFEASARERLQEFEGLLKRVPYPGVDMGIERGPGSSIRPRR